jgi:hypothetical protein
MQRVIVGDGDPTFFVFENKWRKKDDGHHSLGKKGKWLVVDGDIGWLNGAIWHMGLLWACHTW